MACVLVVDDDPVQLLLYERVLAGSGHAVRTAVNPQDALAVLENWEADRVVMDLRLPKLRDGLELIRDIVARRPETRIVVLSGAPFELHDAPEGKLVQHVFSKPVAFQQLLRALATLLFAIGAQAQTYRFAVPKAAEVVAGIEMSSPGADWSREGSEAALADVSVDGRTPQNIMLYAGAGRYRYPAFLGALSAGEHELKIARNSQYSARGAGLEVTGVEFRQVAQGEPGYVELANAPVLYARADTIGKFTDVPMIAYCERLAEAGQPYLQYTVIFSNEDGGTSTRALMARWGRTTDIEYIYKAWMHPSGRIMRATIQAKDHKEIEFRGIRDGSHPILIPSTRNNMVADRGASPIRYQIAPIVADLTAHSREEIMDRFPISYRVMAQELQREGKLRRFGTVDGENISDPLNYLYVEAKAANRTSALQVLVRRKNEDVWRSSDLGRADYAISRDGWFRSTVELPPGTRPDQLAEVAFGCVVSPAKPELLAGVCRIEQVTKMFFLGRSYTPGSNIWSRKDPFELATGNVRSFPIGATF